MKKLTDFFKYIFSDGGKDAPYITLRINKKVLAGICVGVAACVAALIILSFAGAKDDADASTNQKTFSARDMDVSGIDLLGEVIVVDPAHGSGLYNNSAEGIIEEELVLDIAKRVKANLEQRNATVILTRNAPQALADDEQGDLEARAALIERKNPNLIVSIHANWYDDPAASGAQTFFLEQGVPGKKIATAIMDMLNFKIDFEKPRMPIEGAYGILKVSEIPACVVEVGFLSNAGEAALLKTNEYRQQIADAVSDGILLYEKRLRQSN